MEYVIVTYPTNRLVFIDGEKGGTTNKVFRVEAGTHEFDLGSRKNYTPDSRAVGIKGTTLFNPATIAFAKIND